MVVSVSDEVVEDVCDCGQQLCDGVCQECNFNNAEEGGGVDAEDGRWCY